MPRPTRTPSLFALLILALCCAGLSPAPVHASPPCEVGAYRLDDGRVLDVAPSTGQTLRWRTLEGTTGSLSRERDGSWRSHFGWTGRADGTMVHFQGCPADAVTFGSAQGRRIRFRTLQTAFVSHGTRLVGRLVLPPGHGRVPVVVLVHGSEHDSARKFYALQRLLPAQGVAAFVYDKRGTGASGGSYTQKFGLLADDAIAAMHAARRLAGSRAGRIGYQGGSQGGWVVPIAVRREPVDFAIVSFGLAVSVIDEDQEETALEMRLKGYGPDIVAKALTIAAAAERVMASGFTDGIAELNAIRDRYRNEPWYKDVHGNYAWLVLSLSPAQLAGDTTRYRFDTPFHYDPMPTLAAVTVPQLWVLGGQDLEAPSAETSRRLKRLIASGHPITLALYPQTEHGMTEFETDAHGERVSTRYARGYFRMLAQFALHGRLDGTFGAARITRPRTAAEAPSRHR